MRTHFLENCKGKAANFLDQRIFPFCIETWGCVHLDAACLVAAVGTVLLPTHPIAKHFSNCVLLREENQLRKRTGNSKMGATPPSPTIAIALWFWKVQCVRWCHNRVLSIWKFPYSYGEHSALKVEFKLSNTKFLYMTLPTHKIIRMRNFFYLHAQIFVFSSVCYHTDFFALSNTMLFVNFDLSGSFSLYCSKTNTRREKLMQQHLNLTMVWSIWKQEERSCIIGDEALDSFLEVEGWESWVL